MISDLTDERYFPTFEQCPGEHDADLNFFTLKFGYLLSPRRHWCLLAEIKEVEYFLRLRLWVRDRAGHDFPISFYIEDDRRWLDLNRFQPGRTVAVLYAEQHYFLDLTVGIRQESSSTIEVFDMPLDDVLALGETLVRQGLPDVKSKKCHACGAEGNSLLTCAQCRCRWYCSKACQRKAWRDAGHQRACQKERGFQKLLSFDWENFSDHTCFPLC